MSVIIDGGAGVTTNSGAVYNGIASGTVVSATGTSIDFTGIPNWVKRITVMFDGVSTNGTSTKLVQIGSGSVTTTGYNSSGLSGATTVSTFSSTAGFIIFDVVAANTTSGHMVITNISGNSWIESHTVKSSTISIATGAGDVTISGTLDRIRITTVNGTDTFDAGSINILYE
jgi:hypothetical protein